MVITWSAIGSWFFFLLHQWPVTSWALKPVISFQALKDDRHDSLQEIPFHGISRKLPCSEKPSRNSCHESNTSNPNLPSHWNNSDVVKHSYQSVHKRFSTWINVLWKQITYMKSVSMTMNPFQSAGCKVHEHKGCKKILSMFKVQGSLLCLILLYCIEWTNYTNKDLINKVLLLTSCKRGQKFQLTFIRQTHLMLLKLHLTKAPSHLNALYTHAEA
jgi:hypothetical protein